MQIDPRPFGQVLGDAMSGLGRNWKALVSPALYAFIPVGILTLIVFPLTGADEFLNLVLNDPGYLEALSGRDFLEAAMPFLQAVAIALVLQTLAAVYVYLASARVMAKDAAGNPTTGPSAGRFALRRLGVAIVAGLLALAAVAAIFGVGFFIWSIPYALAGTPTATSVLVALVLLAALLGPGIWLSISLSMTSAVVAVEDKGPIGSLKRSFQLVNGRWWATFGFLLLVGLLGSVAIQLIQFVAIPLSVVGDAGIAVSLASVIGIVTQGLIVAGIGAMYAVWYIDLRARNEMLVSDDLS